MTAALHCEGLCAGRDGRAVVRDLSLTIEPGEVVAFLGPNGAGKTTTLLTLAGMLPAISGRIFLHERPIGHRRPHRLVRDGLVLVPDSRALFKNLTVHQHLNLAQSTRSGHPDEVLHMFPALQKRHHTAAGNLSGGEQQMLAIGRALMLRPTVLLIDELSLGLAPIIVQEILPTVAAVARTHLTAVVLVEQHVSLALEVASRAVVLSHGSVVLDESAETVRNDPMLIERSYFAAHADPANPNVPGQTVQADR